MVVVARRHQLDPALLDVLLEYAKWQFSCGNYSGAADYLVRFSMVSTDADKSMSALWGKLATDILMHNWEGALEDMRGLQDFIDRRAFPTPAHQLLQRAWLLHWSLFVFFNHPNGRAIAIEVFLQPAYMSAIQMLCPHILRYLATVIVIESKRDAQLQAGRARGDRNGSGSGSSGGSLIGALVRVLQQESGAYRDPITEFIERLYVDVDFEGAQQKLRECERVLDNDTFLVSCRDAFIESARLAIFEMYCRVHHVVPIGMLAEKLNMTPADAERWIVNLICSAKLDARIDSKEAVVVMHPTGSGTHHSMLHTTTQLSLRTRILVESVDKHMKRLGAGWSGMSAAIAAAPAP